MAISILYPSKRFGHEGVPRKLFTETFQSCACTRFLCMHKISKCPRKQLLHENRFRGSFAEAK